MFVYEGTEGPVRVLESGSVYVGILVCGYHRGDTKGSLTLPFEP